MDNADCILRYNHTLGIQKLKVLKFFGSKIVMHEVLRVVEETLKIPGFFKIVILRMSMVGKQVRDVLDDGVLVMFYLKSVNYWIFF